MHDSIYTFYVCKNLLEFSIPLRSNILLLNGARFYPRLFERVFQPEFLSQEQLLAQCYLHYCPESSHLMNGRHDIRIEDTNQQTGTAQVTAISMAQK